MKLSVAQAIFEDVRGTSFVGIDSETVVSRLKRDEKVQPGVLTKRTTGSTVMVFAQSERSAYSAQVKRRMEAEGLDPDSWDSGPLPYGEWMGDSVFIQHTKKGDTDPTYYLRVHFVHPGKSEYFLDGQPISKANIVDTSAPKIESEQGGQDKKVIPRNYKLDSITAIRIDGAHYKF
jgi:hypothetical protein